eukprot:2619751-Amphidinium_carterae.1
MHMFSYRRCLQTKNQIRTQAQPAHSYCAHSNSTSHSTVIVSFRSLGGADGSKRGWSDAPVPGLRGALESRALTRFICA